MNKIQIITTVELIIKLPNINDSGRIVKRVAKIKWDILLFVKKAKFFIISNWLFLVII